jgi:flagellin-specific chaperone FliS
MEVLLNELKKRMNCIKDKLRISKAPNNLKVEFDYLANLLLFLRNRLLRSNDVVGDLRKIYEAMIKALSDLTTTKNVVQLRELAEHFEELFSLPAGYPESIPERSRIASWILFSLGFVDKRGGTNNYTVFIIDSVHLETLQRKLAGNEPIGYLGAYEKVQKWLSQHNYPRFDIE